MTDFTIATFNVKNLIGADKEYYRFEKYTPEEYAWKRDWLTEQLVSMNADVVCLQEVFERDALADILRETNQRAEALNKDVIPSPKARYARKAIFKKLETEPYPFEGMAFAPNLNDGEPGQRRPGLAILSRFGFVGEPEVIQDLDQPLEIEFPALDGDGLSGAYTLKRLSRPIMKARVPVGDTVVTVFNIHFKSKLGEFIRPQGADFAPEADLTNYDAAGRALGELRSAVRRMGEAYILRRLILDELETGNPVMAMGDFNDSEHAVSSAIVAGETPLRIILGCVATMPKTAGSGILRKKTNRSPQKSKMPK